MSLRIINDIILMRYSIPIRLICSSIFETTFIKGYVTFEN